MSISHHVFKNSFKSHCLKLFIYVRLYWQNVRIQLIWTRLSIVFSLGENNIEIEFLSFQLSAYEPWIILQSETLVLWSSTTINFDHRDKAFVESIFANNFVSKNEKHSQQSLRFLNNKPPDVFLGEHSTYSDIWSIRGQFEWFFKICVKNYFGIHQ